MRVIDISRRVLLLPLLLTLLLATPLLAQEALRQFGRENGRELRLRSTTDIAVLQPAITAFVAENPEISVIYEQWGSNALYQLSLRECREGRPQADAVFSSGVHQMVDLVNSFCATPYRSERTAALPPSRIWRDEIWGITREAAVIVYNRALVREAEVPRSRFALLDLMRRPDSPHQTRIATYDIEASGLGYLFAFSDSLEASTFGALLEGFARSGAVATCCSAEIIAGVASGRFHIAYNVLGSYAATVEDDTLAILHPEDYTLYLSRAYLIPRGAEARQDAARLLEFLLSERGQEILTASGLVEPGHGAGPVAASAERSIAINPTLLIAGDRQRRRSFISQWRAAFGPQQ